MKRLLSVLICLSIFSGVSIQTFAITDDGINSVYSETVNYIYNTVTTPQISMVGGDWTVLALARSDVEIPREYFSGYYRKVEEFIKENKGILHNRKYTEYSRVILALTAIGKNPANVSGYNLLTPLADYEKTVWQGINGSIWALIALDSGNYQIPVNLDATIQATREMYVNYILKCELPGGGWALIGEDADKEFVTADPDVTGMALQALSKYQENEKVKLATQRALSYMSEIQNENGGFSTDEKGNSESCVQMIVALSELGISIDDPRFVKNGKTILDNLLTYHIEGSGFRHTYDEESTNLMATEQCLYSLVALKRYSEGKNSLYDMSDVSYAEDVNSSVVGLQNKNSDVHKMEIVSPKKTFVDISIHKNKKAIEELASRNIINGKSDTVFDPDNVMTRAEFAAIIVKGLGLPEKEADVFSDITSEDWYYKYINTAYFYGIVNGISESEFNPNGTITREEAAVMVARAAKICGMNTEVEMFEARNILAGFIDYVKASDWAVSSLAFCYNKKILPEDVMEIKPREAITRSEIAQMLFNMLDLSELL